MRDHKTVSIADQIFEQLEHEILTGKYARGELLTEMKLSAELGVSRTPIREAIRRLEQEHIVAETGRGIVVVGITKEDVLDMYDIRINLEGLAAERAAKNISEEQLVEMGEVLALQKFYIDKPDNDNSSKIKNLDSQFHTLLYISSKSPAIGNVLQQVHRKITKYRRASVRKHSRAVQSHEEHMAIYAALEAHDSDRARALATEHAKNAKKSIMGMEI